jgi:hypothetical protein
MPADYLAMENAQEHFVETCSVAVAQENAGNAVGMSAKEDVDRAYDEYQVAFNKWISDLHSLGCGTGVSPVS